MEAVGSIGAILIAIWSAITASRALKHRESPRIDIRFVVARPGNNESESANPWRDPAIRITNNGPYDYDRVVIELMGTPNPMGVVAQPRCCFQCSHLSRKGSLTPSTSGRI
jgi:hypothetical protein